MSRVFLSHSRVDSRQAVAVKQWLIEHEPGLVDEIYLDVDPHTGIRPGERWKGALNKATARCEAVICLLSKHWLNSPECLVEFRYAENLHKAILCARLEPVTTTSRRSGSAAICSPTMAPPPKWTLPTAAIRWCSTARVCSGC